MLVTWLVHGPPIFDCKYLFFYDFKPIAKSHFSHAYFNKRFESSTTKIGSVWLKSFNYFTVKDKYH